MKYSSIFVAGFAFIALVGVAPVAWSGSMGNGAAQRSAEFAKSNAKSMPGAAPRQNDEGPRVQISHGAAP